MKNVISISRRTDIPKWHIDWLLGAFQREEVTYKQPGAWFRTVSLRSRDVHSLVFWSKDYGQFLSNQELQRFLERYNLYFHFTITGLGSSFLEHGAPSPPEAIAQLEVLADRWGPQRINWRFDPIVHWINDHGEVCSNAEYFYELVVPIARAGVTRCTFSFCFWYGKCIRRARKYSFRYIEPPDERKVEILNRMSDIASSLGIMLYSCAADKWTKIPGIQKGHCIGGELLTRLHPNQEKAPLGKDRSQRPQCGCTPSVDIGSYSQRCLHGCLYCYANPII